MVRVPSFYKEPTYWHFQLFTKDRCILLAARSKWANLATVRRNLPPYLQRLIRMTIYTAVSFAPVQGFIEKSRKLRDLFGASLILSYLSFKLVKKAERVLGEGCVISPGLINLEGMPNRILVKGYLSREVVQNTLLEEWQKVLAVCRIWVEDNIGIPKDQYFWAQTKEQIGKQKGEWERCGSYAWEVFVGWGKYDLNHPDESLIKVAMDDLETRKLKRDWIAINWVGESSSLSGTDAIAWNRLGEEHQNPGRMLTEAEKEEMELFYYRLAWRLDNPDRNVEPPFPTLQRLKEIEKSDRDNFGKYIAPNERLSIPELVKRLVTYDVIAEDIGMPLLGKRFTEIARMPEVGMEQGRWTGWFMGDGDEIGKKLKGLAAIQDDGKIQQFSVAMCDWGNKFKKKFPPELGRVVYAGGDDFLGILYSNKKQPPIKASDALKWLLELSDKWKDLQAELQNALDIKMSFSVGFVWAGHSVPQRDVLQHCREAEKRAKSLGRDRVTIRVVFNNGQYVQWTCPWDYLDILTKYRDRSPDRKTGDKANWNHLYSDWATLKARHAIRLNATEGTAINKQIALSIFDFYFDDAGKVFEAERLWDKLAGDNTNAAIVNWIDNLIQVGWQLCRNSDP